MDVLMPCGESTKNKETADVGGCAWEEVRAFLKVEICASTAHTRLNRNSRGWKSPFEGDLMTFKGQVRTREKALPMSGGGPNKRTQTCSKAREACLFRPHGHSIQFLLACK